MWIETFITIVGVIMSIGYFPQAYRIYQNKSAHDISLINCGILLFGTTCWTLYGIYINNIVLIISFVVGVIGSGLVLGLSLYYRNKKNNKSKRIYKKR